MSAVNETLAERTLETPRLLLEPLVPQHARLLFADLNDPSLYTLIPRDPPESVDALERRFHRLTARSSPDGREVWLNWVARLRASGEYVGTVEVTVHPDGRAHLAYTVFRRFWRRGFAKEACGRVIESLFTDWEAAVVVAEMDTRNEASVRLAESLGFERIELVPNADSFKGSTSDEYHYELRRFLHIEEATTPALVGDARSLFREYQASLDVDLCFQGFEAELASLPGAYSRPKGRLYVARERDALSGCVALRPLDADVVCEMKRLYVRPQARGLGLGRRLATLAIEEARKIGYSRMRLDTLPSMKTAIALYRELGFVEIAPYRPNPVEGAIFMELRLADERIDTARLSP